MPANASSEKRPSKSDRDSAASTRAACSTLRTAVPAPLAGYVLPGDERDRNRVLGALLRPQPDHGQRPPQRRRGAEHAPALESPIHARQLPGRPGGVLSPVLAPAAPDAVESSGGRELLQKPDSGLAG